MPTATSQKLTITPLTAPLTDMRPLWVGGLIAPLAALVVFFLALLLLSVSKNGWVLGTHDWEAGVMSAFVFVLPMSYLATWLLGMPYIYLLRRKSQLSTLRVCTAAILFGVIAMWVFQLIGKNGLLTWVYLIHGALIGASFALRVALCICWINEIPMKKETE